MNKFLALTSVCVSAVTIVASASAQAASFTNYNSANQTFDYEGETYQLSTMSGSFNELKSDLENQLWWGNATFATDLAAEVQFDLGDALGNNPAQFPFGPLFAWESLPEMQIVGHSWFSNESSNSSLQLIGPTYALQSYVKASIFEGEAPESVPEPSAMFGLAAFGLAGVLKRKLTS